MIEKLRIKLMLDIHQRTVYNCEAKNFEELIFILSKDWTELIPASPATELQLDDSVKSGL